MQVSIPVMVRVPLMEGACKAVPNTVKLESSLSTCRNDCSAGSYITADRTACSLCAFGQYQDQSGQSECKNDCEIGFYVRRVRTKIV